MQIIKVKNYDEMSKKAAELIAKQVKKKPASVLGFATGSSPVGTYKQLIEMYKKNNLDMSKVTTFNLDEYCGLAATHPQSYYLFMMEQLFNHVNIPKGNINLPNGKAADFTKECADYDAKIVKAGGIDLQLLGVGMNGHIGFNEPDKVFHNNTIQVKLTEDTIEVNAKKFFDGDTTEVPKTAISMGIGTIMAAKKIILIAGADKAAVIKKLEKPVVSPKFPISILHYHPDATIIFAEK